MADKDDFVLDMSDDNGNGSVTFDEDIAPEDDFPATGDDEFMLELDNTVPTTDDDDFKLGPKENNGTSPIDDAGDLDDDDSKLQGYDDLHTGFNSPDGSDYAPARNSIEDSEYTPTSAPAPKRTKTTKATQPGFYERTTKNAERSAKRSRVDDANDFVITEDNSLLNSTSTRIPGTFGRINRVKGSTLPAYHKKVTHELDDDDKLIMEMREKGYSDRQIAEKLAKDGRVRYDAKSVSTRVQRIKQAQAEHSDWQLKNGYKEWLLEDDQLLMRAFDQASIEIAYEIERLRAWRFRKTAEWMRRLNKDAVFSASACHERYIALLNGTAAIPCDQDINPEARKADMLKERERREAARDKEQAEMDRKEYEAHRVKEEAQARQAKKAAEIASKRLQIDNEKAARAMKRATAAQMRAQKAEDNNKKQTQRAATIHANRVAAEKAAERKIRDAKFKEDFKLSNFKNITETSPDPRANLKTADIRALCADCKLNSQGSKDALLKRLKHADGKLSAKDLQEMCKAKGIPLGGNKMQMKYQLALAVSKACASYDGDEVEADGMNDFREEADEKAGLLMVD